MALAELFAVDLYAYAVMSNHYQLVLHADPGRVEDWTDEDVAERWLRLCPPRALREMPAADRIDHPIFQRAWAGLCSDPVGIIEIRQRLGSVSWFMRFLNESIARRANLEDGVKGRFWEGRYRSQALLDEAAVLACMAYVDLNPIRAGLTDRIETSDFTSGQARAAAVACAQPGQLEKRLRPLINPSSEAPSEACAVLLMTTVEYLMLLDWTGRAVRSDKVGAIPPDLAPIMTRLRIQPDPWIDTARHFGRRYPRAAGGWQRLREQAAQLGLRWPQGCRRARAVFG